MNSYHHFKVLLEPLLTKQWIIISEKMLVFDYQSFIGSSEPMQTIYKTIEKVAITKASILITGETGTSKELCAEAIHKQSLRADKHFIVCNCAAIPERCSET